ncbi:MAG: hypothetical protein GYA56_08485 [Geobacteraceae bacterium]|nr:hypothetical protein [Geobacteraceae bacterium]
MYVHEIPDCITDRLKTYITGLEIAPFPDKPGEYRLRHPRGALLVHYAGSEAPNPRRVRIAVRVVARFVGDALRFLEAARLIITGWQIPGCSRFEYAGDEFVEEKQGIWEYDIIFTTSSPAAPVGEDRLRDALRELGMP